MTAVKTQIGWYGLGSMGRPMAENLQKHLTKTAEPALIYYNRTMSSGATLTSLGAMPAESFTDLVKESDIIFTMVANDSILEELVTQAVQVVKGLSNKVFVDCSTVHPSTIERLSEKLSQHSAILVSAPVFGGPSIAVTGKLVFALGGPDAGCEAVKGYILDVMGRKIIRCGENAQSSSMLKIGGNIVTLNLMEAVGEAQVFAEQTGLGTTAMEELIAEAFGPVAGGYSQRLTSGIYAPTLGTRPGFGVSLSIKDADHALAITRERKFKLPGLELAKENMAAAREYGGECLDASSMYGILRQQAGLPFWNEKSRQGGKGE